MNWIKLSDKPPLINHIYFWKTKSSGGWSYYGVHGFESQDGGLIGLIEEIFWLDEMAPDVELTVNELRGVLKKWVEQDAIIPTLSQIIINRIKELENNCQQDHKQGDMCGLK